MLGLVNTRYQLYFSSSCILSLLSHQQYPGFPSGSVVKNPPAMQETWVQSLGQENSLEEGMATHSSILAWRIPWTEEPGRLWSIGSQRVGQLKHLSTHTHTHTHTHTQSNNLLHFMSTLINSMVLLFLSLVSISKQNFSPLHSVT